MQVQAGFSPYRANINRIAPLTVEKASMQTSHNHLLKTWVAITPFSNRLYYANFVLTLLFPI
ncbi:MAG TPA: hypothetical protein DCE56_45480, partial [Cyanobacteria bacterium UBA8553]|nr:hypothetical protein [Cyanobacteria bacterium UBA8553]